jgi:hypothetical protein
MVGGILPTYLVYGVGASSKVINLYIDAERFPSSTRVGELIIMIIIKEKNCHQCFGNSSDVHLVTAYLGTHCSFSLHYVPM